MTKLPAKIVLNLDTQKVFIDGEEFPWYIVEDSIDVDGLMTKKAIPALTLSIAESAVAQHEILLSYIKAGFSRPEALELLKTLILTGSNQK